MFLETAETPPVDVYHLLIGIVTPRPIGWVTTLDAEDRVNLAPYSFFNAFGASPPVVAFAPAIRLDGTRKDTLLNIEATGEFVLNAAVDSLAEAVNLTSAEVPRGRNEAEMAGLTLEPSRLVGPPRVAESPTHLECRLLQIVSTGEGPMAGQLVIGQVVAMHVADRVLDERGRIDPRKLGTIGRLGGKWYSRTTDLFELERPG